jgi:putative mRNA 3-end processing factor
VRFSTPVPELAWDFELKPLIRWSDGVAIRYGETRLHLDPLDSDPTIPNLFITHAHYDHSKGFQFPLQKKYSTKETYELCEADIGRKAGNWEPIRVGRRVRLGEVEVEAHDAGHVLGSVQYEIITPDEIVVYASHINFTDTLVSKAAEVAPCDTLILEATFPAASQTLPPRESIVADIVKWTLECIGERRVPTFATDPIGNAQELVRVFNTWTELPVIVHPRIARISQVYANNGIGLRFVDAATEEARSLIEDAKCVVIIPKRFDATRYGEFRVAHVTSWPTAAERTAGKVFTLSEQADLNQLLRFVKEARPKTVFTFRGGSKLLAELVSKRFGMLGRALVADVQRAKPSEPKLDEGRVGACEDFLLKLIQVQDFTYEKAELVARVFNEGFKLQEVEAALNRLTSKSLLRYSEVTGGYSLPNLPP